MHRRVGANSVVVAAAAAIGIMCLSGRTEAATVTAGIGKSAPTPGNGCFWLNESSVANTCGTANRWEVPLVVTQGAKTATIEVWNPWNDGSFKCTLYAATPSGSLITGTTQTAPNNTTSIPNVLSLSVTVPYRGIAYVYCNVGRHGTIGRVTYSH